MNDNDTLQKAYDHLVEQCTDTARKNRKLELERDALKASHEKLRAALLHIANPFPLPCCDYHEMHALDRHYENVATTALAEITDTKPLKTRLPSKDESETP
jgi:hypothetical protein